MNMPLPLSYKHRPYMDCSQTATKQPHLASTKSPMDYPYILTYAPLASRT